MTAPLASSGPLEGVPAGLASADLGQGSVSLTVDDSVYPLEALYGAAYIFIDRCYVLLDRPSPGRYRVTLTPKRAQSETAIETLRAFAGEFANELLSCAWRHQITQQNRAAIESVTMQAIASAMGPPSLEDLATFDFTEEAFEDPLGIAVSWEEKYKKKEKEPLKDAGAQTPAQPPAAEARPAEPKRS